MLTFARCVKEEIRSGWPLFAVAPVGIILITLAAAIVGAPADILWRVPFVLLLVIWGGFFCACLVDAWDRYRTLATGNDK